MKFYTAINCMDGRVQLPVNNYLRKRFNVEYVDTITEASPVFLLSEKVSSSEVQSILNRLRISIERHHSIGLAIVGHHDCAGNPVHKTRQIEHLRKSIKTIEKVHENIEIIGLWVNENWEIEELR